nr:hypothetical protein Iba_chr04dCG4260 [Ipomoea batatas]
MEPPSNHEQLESGGSPRGLLQLQLDRTSFCVELNEAVENEWAGLITSLGRNNRKGIVIHEKPAGLQSNKESGGSLRGLLQLQLDRTSFCVELNEAVENECAGLITSLGRNNGKGIVIHEKPAGLQSNKNPTIMRNAGWSMVGMNGTSFGSSNPNNHLANLQNDNQVPVPHAGLQRNKVSSGNLSVEGKGKGILIEENVHSGKFSSKPYICANFQNPTIMQGAGSLFDDVMPSEAEMEELMDFINSDLEGDETNLAEIFDDIMEEVEKRKRKKEVDAVQGDETDFTEIFGDIMEEIEKEKEKEVDAVQRDETDLAEIFGDIMDDGPIVDSFYEKYWRD